MTATESQNGLENKVIMSGTIKRGRKSQDLVEIELELNEKDLHKIQNDFRSDSNPSTNSSNCKCSSKQGVHIVLATVLFTPFALIYGICVNYYYATMCWYDVYLTINDRKSVFKKILFCPLLVIFYPIFICLHCILVGIFSAFKQIKCDGDEWLIEIRDYDKGILALYCKYLGFPECSPYEVVTLTGDNTDSNQSANCNINTPSRSPNDI